jgi:3-hydroxypropanoate dehydrogenase
MTSRDGGRDIFENGRTFSHWLDRPVPPETIRAVADLAKLGPTSANCSPARIVFVASAEGRARLRPLLDPGNVEKTMSAPVTAVIGYDTTFYERLDRLFPHEPEARSWFEGKPEVIRDTAFRNGSLQGAYLMMAARALGLDCGPMSGFDRVGVEREFFPEGHIRANFLCNLGFGDRSRLHPRSPRFTFDEFCSIV